MTTCSPLTAEREGVQTARSNSSRKEDVDFMEGKMTDVQSITTEQQRPLLGIWQRCLIKVVE